MASFSNAPDPDSLLCFLLYVILKFSASAIYMPLTFIAKN